MGTLPTHASVPILTKLYRRDIASTSGTVLVSAVASFAALLKWFAR